VSVYYEIRFWDLASSWRQELVVPEGATGGVSSPTEILDPNGSTEIISRRTPHRFSQDTSSNWTLEEGEVTPCSTVIINVKMRDADTREILARCTDWPMPFRYIDFPDPELRVSYGIWEGEEELLIVVEKPIKCLVLSIRDSLPAVNAAPDTFGTQEVSWEDNGVDIWPGEHRTIGCNGLAVGKRRRALWGCWMGCEKGRLLLEEAEVQSPR
jgi:beta-mannosidase